jgi:hypothetical protein
MRSRRLWAFASLLSLALGMAQPAPALALSWEAGMASEPLLDPAQGPALDLRQVLAFLAPVPMTEGELAMWAGQELTREPEQGPTHYLLRDWGPHRGGVDLYLNPKGEVEEALFYVAAGPLFTPDQAEATRGLRARWSLFDLQRALGAPDEVVASQTSRTTRWIYRFPGGRLTCQSLPFSPGIHRLVASRE